jgi:hypothetical protein
MSLLSVARVSGLARRLGLPAMSTAASSLKQCLLNVPPTEVSCLDNIFRISSICLFSCFN